ncbi:MAG: SDR family oxidoreductase [Ignavibacteriae bacterium]|nr:MAG: SDR family oxidoreductase [Ignavibacteriota bacterium]
MPIVFITGGARRIGRQLALGFARQGWDVGITYHTSAEAATETVGELHALGVRADMKRCDVSNDDELSHAFRRLCETLGTPDVVVSNAGIFPDRRSVDDLDTDALRATLNVNTTPFLTIAREYRTALAGTDRRGRLIAMSSLGALEIWKDRIDYNVSKASLVTLVQTLARSLAPTIAVNTVAPGAIVLADEPSAADAAVASTERIPMGRYGNGDDVFDAVWFFATCTNYITGQLLAVDGGYRLVR